MDGLEGTTLPRLWRILRLNELFRRCTERLQLDSRAPMMTGSADLPVSPSAATSSVTDVLPPLDAGIRATVLEILKRLPQVQFYWQAATVEPAPKPIFTSKGVYMSKRSSERRSLRPSERNALSLEDVDNDDDDDDNGEGKREGKKDLTSSRNAKSSSKQGKGRVRAGVDGRFDDGVASLTGIVKVEAPPDGTPMRCNGIAGSENVFPMDMCIDSALPSSSMAPSSLSSLSASSLSSSSSSSSSTPGAPASRSRQKYADLELVIVAMAPIRSMYLGLKPDESVVQNDYLYAVLEKVGRCRYVETRGERRNTWRT